MKLNSVTTTFIVILFLSNGIYADEPVSELDILAERGKGVVTQDEFTARTDKIPANVRKGVLRDRNRVGELLQSLLINSQLAADAREAGFDKQEVVLNRMKLAANKELAEAWLAHYVEQNSTADFEALAYEYYLLNQKIIMTQPKIDVSHILISTKERPDADAKMLAETIHLQLMNNPLVFDEFIIEYSEDPSVASNNGKFLNVKKGDMVKPFEVRAFALKPGDISEPVKSEYGYHIIRLDAYNKPKKLAFEEVKDRLIEIERKKHIDRVKDDYLRGLSSLEMKMTEDQLREMVRREFGEEYINSESLDK